MKRKPTPRLPDGTIDWGEVARRQDQWHEDRWNQLCAQRRDPEKAKWLEIPTLVRAYSILVGTNYRPPKAKDQDCDSDNDQTA